MLSTIDKHCAVNRKFRSLLNIWETAAFILQMFEYPICSRRIRNRKSRQTLLLRSNKTPVSSFLIVFVVLQLNVLDDTILEYVWKYHLCNFCFLIDRLMMIINSPFYWTREADSHNGIRIGFNFGYGSVSKLKPAKKTPFKWRELSIIFRHVW